MQPLDAATGKTTALRDRLKCGVETAAPASASNMLRRVVTQAASASWPNLKVHTRAASRFTGEERKMLCVTSIGEAKLDKLDVSASRVEQTRPSVPLSRSLYVSLCDPGTRRLTAVGASRVQGNELLDMQRRTLLSHGRSFPMGLRTDSSNMDPMKSWRAGLQMAALNLQTNDVPAQLH
jgi:hypothetical protein